ncbi:MAG TPA: cyclic nucleotide-binding domain-containing protein [Terracidiphilus sp.]|nr:cyclic nucleotide-binding domain-containing protein [Terriglobia bacterium]HEV2487941.1 cyclic nucleotide-binding domain-containing protein [Terracidiphilus sp.]
MQLDSAAFLADPELVQALEVRATPIPCDEDRVLFHQGDPPIGLYILFKGEATLSMTSEHGDSLMTIQAAAGSLLGLPGTIGNQPYSLTAIAHRGARVGFIARNDFNALMQSELPLLLLVLQVLASEVRSARIAITQL